MKYIPDGEVFSCPVKTSINGRIQFNTPTLYAGSKFENVCLEFENGKVELLQQNTGVEDAERSTPALNMIASFDDLGQDAGRIIRRWFEYHERLEPALNLYFAVIFNRSLYSNHRFLFLAQALEVYHRINPSFTGGVQPQQSFASASQD